MSQEKTIPVDTQARIKMLLSLQKEEKEQSTPRKKGN